MSQATQAPQEAAAARAGLAEALVATGRSREASTLFARADSLSQDLTLSLLWPEHELPIRSGVALKEAVAPLESLPPVHIVVRLDEYLLQIRQYGAVVAEFSVGVGMDNRTPRGEFTIANKLEHPVWFNRGAGVPPGDPRNPLGAYWMGLGKQGRPTSYGIHPTEDAASIGGSRSRGCIRMKPEDAALLFQWCRVGTPVSIL